MRTIPPIEETASLQSLLTYDILPLVAEYKGGTPLHALAKKASLPLVGVKYRLILGGIPYVGTGRKLLKETIETILYLLREEHCNPSEAAKELGLSTATTYRVAQELWEYWNRSPFDWETLYHAS